MTTFTKDSIFFYLLLLTIVFAIIKLLYSKYIHHIITYYFSTSYQQQKNQNILEQQFTPSFIVNMFSLWVFATFIIFYRYPLLQHHAHEFSWLIDIVLLWLLFVSLIFISYLFMRMLRHSLPALADICIFETFLSIKTMGPLLIPFIWIMAFASTNIVLVAQWIAIAVLVILFIIQYYKILYSIIKIKKRNILFFLLYFCILEWPLLIYISYKYIKELTP